jgi:hypothetical protein
MSNLETVDIVVTLSSNFWKNAPKAKVYVDAQLIFDGEIADQKEIKWSGELTEDSHTLAIELYDKDKYQTVVENDKIVKDQLLNIDEISFDEINIGYLKHTHSNYYPRKDIYGDSAPELVKNCINLGYNGRWEIKFSTPIYIWLLENI